MVVGMGWFRVRGLRSLCGFSAGPGANDHRSEWCEKSEGYERSWLPDPAYPSYGSYLSDRVAQAVAVR